MANDDRASVAIDALDDRAIQAIDAVGQAHGAPECAIQAIDGQGQSRRVAAGTRMPFDHAMPPAPTPKMPSPSSSMAGNGRRWTAATNPEAGSGRGRIGVRYDSRCGRVRESHPTIPRFTAANHLPGMHPTDSPPAPVTSPWAGEAHRRVHRYLRCLRCPAATAEDLTQETLLQALRRFAVGEKPPLPWLFKTARNLWLQMLRRQQREQLVGELDGLHEGAMRELGADGGDARVAALRDCMSTLPARSRLAVQLRYRDGMTRAAVAERIGLSDDGCKNLFERVRDALRTCMERSLWR